MNREILFRGKCKATGIWVYGLPLTETTLSNSITHIAQYADNDRKFGRTNVLVDPKTIGQYTGLKDKNGVKIFEGDIGIRELSKKHTEWVDYWQVVFDEKSAGFITVLIKEFRVDKLVDVDYELNSFSKRFNELEVIGNVHDD